VSDKTCPGLDTGAAHDWHGGCDCTMAEITALRAEIERLKHTPNCISLPATFFQKDRVITFTMNADGTVETINVLN
jgi:hypothetical protein